MIAEVKHYFAQERGEEGGCFAAEMVPGFIAKKLALMKESTEDMLGIRETGDCLLLTQKKMPPLPENYTKIELKQNLQD